MNTYRKEEQQDESSKVRSKVSQSLLSVLHLKIKTIRHHEKVFGVKSEPILVRNEKIFENKPFITTKVEQYYKANNGSCLFSVDAAGSGS